MTPRGTLFGALFAVSAIAAAQGAIDFRGVPLGASEAHFRANLPGFYCRGPLPGTEHLADRICLPNTYADRASFGGAVTTTMIVTFVDDRFVGLMAAFKEGEFDKVRDALLEKFGKPTSTERPEFQTRGGLRAVNEVLTWQRGSGAVLARRYGSSITEASVQYVDDRGAMAAQSRAKEAAKKNAKSL
mgnify:FL=1